MVVYFVGVGARVRGGRSPRRASSSSGIVKCWQIGVARHSATLCDAWGALPWLRAKAWSDKDGGGGRRRDGFWLALPFLPREMKFFHRLVAVSLRAERRCGFFFPQRKLLVGPEVMMAGGMASPHRGAVVMNSPVGTQQWWPSSRQLHGAETLSLCPRGAPRANPACEVGRLLGAAHGRAAGLPILASTGAKGATRTWPPRGAAQDPRRRPAPPRDPATRPRPRLFVVGAVVHLHPRAAGRKMCTAPMKWNGAFGSSARFAGRA